MAVEFGKVIREVREKNDWTLEEMAQRLGTTKQALSKYERGERTPKITVAAKFAEILNMPLSALVGVDDNLETLPEGFMKISRMQAQKIRVLGSVAAGKPIYDEEYYGVYVDSPVKADYALRVKGDSMEPLYQDGDVIYVREIPSVHEGTVAVVLINDEICLKRVYYIPNGVQLVSLNPKYPPMIYQLPEYDNIRIMGIVVGFTRMFK